MSLFLRQGLKVSYSKKAVLLAKIGVSYSFCYVIDKKEAIIGKKVGEIFGGSKKGSTFAFVNVTQEKGHLNAPRCKE